MHPGLEMLHHWAYAVMPVLLDAVVKGTVLLLAAALLVLALYRASAALRQMVWLLALAALLVMPLVSAALPSWRVLPSWAQLELVAPQPSQPLGITEKSEDSSQRMNPKDLGASVVLSEHRLPTQFTKDDTEAGSEVPFAKAIQPSVAATTAAPPVTPSTAASSMPSRWMRVVPWLMLLWAVGIVSCLVPVVLGRLSLRRLARRSRQLDDSAWSTLTDRAAKAIDLRHPVTLLQSNAEPMPMVWGLWQSRLLLPAEAETWPQDRRWVVLLHEMAHAKRRDCLAKLIAQLACAVYWFNPLCWTAFKLMQREAEVACDDLVLAAGHRPSDYAQHLLEIASGLNSGMLASYSSIGMARKSKLEGRLLAILDPRRSRGSLTRMGVLAVVILITGVVLPLSVIKAIAAEDTPAPVVSVQPQATVAATPSSAFLYKAQVVDRDGKPIAGVQIELTAMKGEEKDQWQGETDAAGRFQWSTALAEKLLLDVSKEGYREIGSRQVTAGAEEQKIKLLKVLTINGAVTDGVTKKPIASFSAMPAFSWRGADDKIIEHDEAKTFSEKYSLEVAGQYAMNWVYVEAPGHKPALSPALTDEEGTVTVDLALTPAKDLAALVLGVDGQPAAGADVHVREPGDAHWVVSPFGQGLDPRGPGPMAARLKTGADGRFTLPNSGQLLRVAVLRADGYAVVTSADLEKSERITLKKWGRIEGSLGAALGATAGQVIVVQSFAEQDDARAVTFRAETSVDASGHFVVDYVPPGKIFIFREVRLEKPFTGSTVGDHPALVDVGEGQTVPVQLGGRGIAVRATVVPFAGLDFTKVLAHAELGVSYKTLFPPGFFQWSPDARQKWSKTPEAHAADLELRRLRAINSYVALVGADGTFVIPDVPAGKYMLGVTVTEPYPGPGWSQGKDVGSIRREIEVPADAKADMDLGSLPLSLKLPMGAVATGPGARSPTFAVSDRGITVIRGMPGNFKAVWVAPSKGAVPFDNFSLKVEEANPYARGWMQGNLATKDGKVIPVAWLGSGDLAAMLAGITRDSADQPYWAILLSDASVATFETAWGAFPAATRDRWIVLVPGKVDQAELSAITAKGKSSAPQPATSQPTRDPATNGATAR